MKNKKALNTIRMEILKASHLEHFKHAKDLALIYPIEHPKRLLVEKELNILSSKINF